MKRALKRGLAAALAFFVVVTMVPHIDTDLAETQAANGDIIDGRTVVEVSTVEDLQTIRDTIRTSGGSYYIRLQEDITKHVTSITDNGTSGGTSYDVFQFFNVGADVIIDLNGHIVTALDEENNDNFRLKSVFCFYAGKYAIIDSKGGGQIVADDSADAIMVTNHDGGDVTYVSLTISDVAVSAWSGLAINAGRQDNLLIESGKIQSVYGKALSSTGAGNITINNSNFPPEIRA